MKLLIFPRIGCFRIRRTLLSANKNMSQSVFLLHLHIFRQIPQLLIFNSFVLFHPNLLGACFHSINVDGPFVDMVIILFSPSVHCNIVSVCQILLCLPNLASL